MMDMRKVIGTVAYTRKVMHGIMLAGKIAIALCLTVAAALLFMFITNPNFYYGVGERETIIQILYLIAFLLLFAFFSFVIAPIVAVIILHRTNYHTHRHEAKEMAVADKHTDIVRKKKRKNKRR